MEVPFLFYFSCFLQYKYLRHICKKFICLIDSALSLDETTEEILDEDEVLGVSVPYKCNDINIIY